MHTDIEAQPREIAAFVAVADKLHFRRAAASLYLTAPVVTRRLAALERRYGVHLISRDSHTVALTPQGRAFLPVARALLEQLRATNRELTRLAQSPLQVAWAPDQAGSSDNHDVLHCRRKGDLDEG